MFMFIVVIMSSCTSRSGKLVEQREAAAKVAASVPLLHPDQLPTHILIHSTNTINKYKRACFVYNYSDSTYSTVYLPTLYVNKIALGDTITSKL